MARGKSLEYILNGVRAEARLSLLPAHNVQVRDSQIALIQREQDRLWGDFNWPHLRVERLVALQAGQAEYAVPTGLSIDRVEKIFVKDGGEWRELHGEIGQAQYSVYDTELDERSWPARNWRATEDDQIEIWPKPDQNGDAATLEGYIKVVGIRNLRPLTADAHVADLDDRLLMLYCAATLLAASGAKDASIKLEAANRLYGQLKGKQTKTSSFNMFSTVQRHKPRRPAIVRYTPSS
jgi:hypothetical protein